MNFLLSVLLFLLNFFFLDRDPKKCARFHGDKHIHKMILEYAQIGSTVFWIVGRHHDGLYKPTHKNHPIVVWASKSLAHLRAIIDLGIALSEERSQRLITAHKMGKKWSTQHASTGILLFMKNNLPPPSAFKDGDAWIDPPLCMPQCLHNKGKDVVDCYRLYYCGYKTEVTNLKWEPFVSNPFFLDDCKLRISTMTDVLNDIQLQVQKAKKPVKRIKK